MPPRRAKKTVAPKPQSSSDAESDHEAPAQSLTSKLASKFKSIVGLETEQPKPAPAKRKRASSVADRHDGEAETTSGISKATPERQYRTMQTSRKSSAKKPPAKRPRKSVVAITKEESSDDEDEEDVAVATTAKKSARAPRTKQSTRKQVEKASTSTTKKARKSVAATGVKEEASASESEDELAVAPVSPVKPGGKGKAKVTVPRRSPRKSAPASGKKSTTTGARKKGKAKDDYDSSIRELSHDSASPTPSESDDNDLEDYNPKREVVKEELADEEEEEEAALETMEVDSEALDDESDFGPHKIAERASASPTKKHTVKAEKTKGRKSVAQSGRRSTGKRAKEATSEEEYESDQSGMVTVSKIVKAPQTGHVPPGQVSRNTFDFLLNLQDPEKNDREWFKLHDPIFRLAEKEWVAFVDAWVTELVEVDDEIPPLPPKDVIHRIYRDVRFSNDKSPYKTNFSASTSRSGRKGIFAGYHISIKPGGESMVAAGTWCPNKDEVQSIRNVIKRNHGRRLREILAEPSFVEYFGPPKPVATKGKAGKLTKQSIFGAEDELKVAPAGVKKDHPDIDLLKCRSFAVAYRFTDAQVLHKDFLEKTLKPVLAEMRPFVRCLNDYMTLPLDEMSEASSSSSSSDNE